MSLEKRRDFARPVVKKGGRSEPRQDTAEKLKAVGLSLFATQGYAETSTKQICEVAGANSAAVTYHFETKQNLLLAILTEQISQNSLAVEHILKAPENIDAFRVRLRLFCETFIDFRVSNPDFHRLLMREAFRIPEAFERFRTGVKSMEASLISFLKAAKKSRFISGDVDISTSAFLLFQLMTGPRLDAAPKMHPDFNIYDVKKRELYIDRMLGLFYHGVLSSSSPARPASV